MICTTNAIESLNMSLGKITRNRGSFPSDEVLLKLFYLTQQNMDDADKGLESCAEPFYYPARRQDAAALTNSVYTKFRTPLAVALRQADMQYRFIAASN